MSKKSKTIAPIEKVKCPCFSCSLRRAVNKIVKTGNTSLVPEAFNEMEHSFELGVLQNIREGGITTTRVLEMLTEYDESGPNAKMLNEMNGGKTGIIFDHGNMFVDVQESAGIPAGLNQFMTRLLAAELNEREGGAFTKRAAIVKPGETKFND